MKTKKSNLKRRRRLIVLIGFLIVVVIGAFFLFRKVDYSVTYPVDDFEITESYHKDQNYYSFLLKKNETEYFTIINHQHFSSQKIIYSIDVKTTENESCLVISSGKARFQPLCLINNEQVSSHLVSEEMQKLLNITKEDAEKKVLDTYEKINIYNYLNANYYIWNYRGFYRLNQDKKETISLFSKDIYAPNLNTQVGNTLFIPDYEANYYFKKVYLINMETGKVETWELSDNVYFDSTILGVYENNLYLVDKHEKVEWMFNLEKKKMTQVGTESSGGKIYQHHWEDISMNKLIYQDNFFTGLTIYDFKIQNQSLYAIIDNHQIKIRAQEPSEIISFHDGFVYYLIDNALYAYNEILGEVLLMDYFEWNFNHDNLIFIAN